MDSKTKILIALGVGVAAFSLIQSQKRPPVQTPVYPAYPSNYPQQQKGKGWETAAQATGFLANLANTLFGQGGVFAPKR
ncbi:hypothetical protein Halhy_4051 [Haliscomenobacter hydrossis DSM 1100]|uniref:Uncharacterized protein n=1 Tax=Haliscomenobacter hydrossis (strain ATCC 27775 / DSM 1100 / LMG 10767 / O) TaxID=760192 RepID=F4L6U4_HALH1|nr:hypothetical protein Halhy_4051 [Haliscomenobacter hydrossis DSM 1100]